MKLDDLTKREQAALLAFAQTIEPSITLEDIPGELDHEENVSLLNAIRAVMHVADTIPA